MSNIIEQLQAAHDEAPHVSERRRRGEADHGNPELVRLLRQAPGIAIGPVPSGRQPETDRREADAGSEEDPLRAFAGLMVSVPLSLALWGIIWLLT